MNRFGIEYLDSLAVQLIKSTIFKDKEVCFRFYKPLLLIISDIKCRVFCHSPKLLKIRYKDPSKSSLIFFKGPGVAYIRINNEYEVKKYDRSSQK